MTPDLAGEIAQLKQMTNPQLRTRYAQLFGEETRANHKTWLIKRLAWRLQALAEGDLCERARQRAAELANDADLRLSPPKPKAEPKAASSGAADSERRILPAGAILSRTYKGKRLEVLVLKQGFEYQGQVFKSLSALAKTITGSHCNGHLFFGLSKPGSKS